MKIYLIFLFLCYSNIYAQNFERISKEILQCQTRINESYDREMDYYQLREKTNLLENVHNKQNQDTIYLLELEGDPAYTTLYSLVWNKTDTVFYQAERLGKGKIINDEKNALFSDYMCDLVSQWDREELNNEGEINSRFIIIEYVNATRIIINKKKYRVDCICFKFFINPDRDKFDYIPKN